MASLDYINFSDTVPSIMISVYDAHACSLSITRRVRCWGWNGAQQLGDTTSASRGTSSTDSISLSVYVTFAPSINSIPITNLAVGTYEFKIHR
jgi:hypothetical protein